MIKKIIATALDGQRIKIIELIKIVSLVIRKITRIQNIRKYLFFKS
jgi:hypothetical protein